MLLYQVSMFSELKSPEKCYVVCTYYFPLHPPPPDFQTFLFKFNIIGHSDAASGWAGWALAHPEFGSSVHPIPTREAD